MPTITVPDVSFDVECEKCGHALDATVKIWSGSSDPTVKVTPYENCLDEARSEE